MGKGWTTPTLGYRSPMAARSRAAESAWPSGEELMTRPLWGSESADEDAETKNPRTVVAVIFGSPRGNDSAGSRRLFSKGLP
ncbi:hypothetical protein ZWY2020_024932 [Hordeum vulgare]|nr:hypothetical protein ZWY2020_024932 [Hordeum vulgare]